jgi:ribonuclease HI
MITKIYADGGVIGHNPSAQGGTWACILVNDADGAVGHHSGAITPAQARVDAVTNNLTELLAILNGLKRVPADFTGTVYSDSMVSLGRVFLGWKWANVPQWMHEFYQTERKRLVHWDAITFVLLDGHPTRAQLAAGIGKRGHPVSIYNVLCDKLCGETAEDYLRR